MFGLSPLGLFFLALLALVIIGPKMLPASVEAVWLTLTNLQRQQRNEEPLTLEEARVIWRANRSILFQMVEVLNAVVEHLEEMRIRIIRMAIALVIGTTICFALYNQIYAILLRPISHVTLPPAPNEPASNPTVLVLNKSQVVTATITLESTTGAPSVPVQASITLPAGTTLSVDLPTQPDTIRPVFLRPTEMFTTTFRVSIMGGLALALPIIVYEVVAFIWPALIYAHERRWVFILVPSVSVFFVSGVLFAYFFLLPFALKYLLTFGGGIAQALPSISEIISFTTNLMFGIGLVFQTPLVVFFLAKAKIVSYQRLKSLWKVAVLISFTVGAIITPTPDPVNQAVVAIPIFLLYLIGVLLARFA